MDGIIEAAKAQCLYCRGTGGVKTDPYHDREGWWHSLKTDEFRVPCYAQGVRNLIAESSAVR